MSLTTLVAEDWTELISRVLRAHRGDDEISCDSRLLARMSGAIEYLAEANGESDDVTVSVMADLITWIAHYQPLANGDNFRLAAYAAAVLAKKNGALLLLKADDLTWLRLRLTGASASEEASEELVGWVRERYLGFSTAMEPAFPMRIGSDEVLEPVRAFVAVPMTPVDDRELTSLERWSSVASAALEKEGLSVYQTIQETHPLRHQVAVLPAVHHIDMREIARSDLFLAFVNRPSTGVGLALGYAQRYRCCQAVLCWAPAGQSPLLRGSAADAELLEVDEATDIEVLIREFVDRRRADLESHRDERVQRILLLRPDVVRLKKALLDAASDPLLGDRLPVGLSVARLQEIFTSLDHFAGASVSELAAIRMME